MKKVLILLFCLVVMPSVANSVEPNDDTIFVSVPWNDKLNANIINSQSAKTNEKNIFQINQRDITKNTKRVEKNDNNNKSKSDILSIYLGAGLGTTGIDIMGGVYYKNFIGVRGNYAFMPRKITSFLDNMVSGASGNIQNAKSNFSLGGLDLSIRPFFGAFRIDVGMRFMNYNIEVNAYEMINNTFGINAGIVGNAKFSIGDGVKPYLGLGWDWNPFLGFTIGFDVGVIYTGQWKISKMNVIPAYANMTQTQQESIATEINRASQEVQNVKNEVNNKMPNFLQFWPVIKLNIGYRFNI